MRRAIHDNHQLSNRTPAGGYVDVASGRPVARHHKAQTALPSQAFILQGDLHSTGIAIPQSTFGLGICPSLVHLGGALSATDRATSRPDGHPSLPEQDNLQCTTLLCCDPHPSPALAPRRRSESIVVVAASQQSPMALLSASAVPVYAITYTPASQALEGF